MPKFASGAAIPGVFHINALKIYLYMIIRLIMILNQLSDISREENATVVIFSTGVQPK